MIHMDNLNNFDFTFCIQQTSRLIASERTQVFRTKVATVLYYPPLKSIIVKNA
jgi:hypothetical protein